MISIYNREPLLAIEELYSIKIIGSPITLVSIIVPEEVDMSEAYSQMISYKGIHYYQAIINTIANVYCCYDSNTVYHDLLFITITITITSTSAGRQTAVSIHDDVDDIDDDDDVDGDDDVNDEKILSILN